MGRRHPLNGQRAAALLGTAFVSFVARADEPAPTTLAPLRVIGDHAADRVSYLGPGRSPGDPVFNLGGTLQATSSLQFFARIANLLDRHYASAAQLGPTGLDGSGHFVARPFPAAAQGRYPLRHSTFYAPGAPRLFSLGLSYAFD